MKEEIITHNNNLYVVYRKVRQNQILEKNVTKIKELWFCDIVLKRKNMEDNYYYFLREISDVIIVDDTTPIKTPDVLTPPENI
jgi:uncharacterized secreted protein with C-terminal beta-propeller domain